MTVGYLLLSVAAAMAYFILPTTPLSKLLLYNGIGLSAVIATLVGIRHKRGENREHATQEVPSELFHRRAPFPQKLQPADR